jgi:hypothetical protein
MIGKITSIEQDGPKRNVRLVISAAEVSSEISSPSGSIHPQDIDHYEVSGIDESPGSLVTLSFVLKDQRRVQFYTTHSKFDFALLLDQLDATIGARKREISHIVA